MPKKKAPSSRHETENSAVRRAAPGEATLTDYNDFLADAKARIGQAQVRAAVAVTRELLSLYWSLGRALVERQERHAWGSSIVERLARDLAAAFPGVQGFSSRNLWRMRAFFLAHPPEPISATAVAEMAPGGSATTVAELGLPPSVVELPWGHQITLIEQLKEAEERLWYARAARENGWSRAILELQIESGARKRWGQSQTNFTRALPPSQSDLAQQVLKDPYNFEFLTLARDAEERALELGLLEHLQKFLLELGVGFAFVGRQYHLEVGGDDFYVDLLFYHLRLRCFIVVELKNTGFKPEYIGKLNFYQSVLDDKLRHPSDAPTIGILMCRSKNGPVVEYALRDIAKPMGVSTFRVTERLPAAIADSLPSIEQLEAAMTKSQAED